MDFLNIIFIFTLKKILEEGLSEVIFNYHFKIAQFINKALEIYFYIGKLNS